MSGSTLSLTFDALLWIDRWRTSKAYSILPLFSHQQIEFSNHLCILMMFPEFPLVSYQLNLKPP